MITKREKELIQWAEVCSLYSSFAQCYYSKEIFQNLTVKDYEQARHGYLLIAEMKTALEKNLSPCFSGIHNVHASLKIAAKGGVLSLEELYRIGRSISVTNDAKEFFDDNRDNLPLCSAASFELVKLRSEEKKLNSAITDEIKLNTAMYPHIGRIENEINSLQNEIKQKINAYVHAPENSDLLQERIVTTVHGRYAVLVKTSSRSRVQGTVLDTSSSGQTLYFEPSQFSAMNERLLDAENRLNAEIFEIVRELSQIVGEASVQIETNLRCCGKLDYHLACAKSMQKYSFSCCELADYPLLDLQMARHPLLINTENKVIANSFVLNETSRGMLITGANTGGKTVLLKTAALCTLLASYGLPVPASPDSRIGRFSRIMIDIGDDQSIERSLSSFSGQIVAVKEMIEASCDASLILIDEIISGTDPRQAAALSVAVLKHFEIQKSFVIVTTHYPELKEYAAVSSYYQNASVSFDLETLTPTYRLVQGVAGVSYAFEIAKIYGLDDSIVQSARDFLTSHELDTERALANAHKTESELAKQKEDVEHLKSQLVKQKENYNELNEKLRVRIEKLKEDKTIDYIVMLDSLKDRAQQKIRELQNADMKQTVQIQEELMSEIERANTQLAGFKDKKFSKKYEPFDANTAGCGDTVFVVPLEAQGEIVDLDIKKQEAIVLLGKTMRSRFAFSQLKTVARNAEKTAGVVIKNTALRTYEEDIPVTLQTSYNTIDLRGMRADEAIALTDESLDRMIRDGLSTAIIIHGHGTGALKSAIRERLKFSSYVQNFRPGAQNEGGDGVTVVKL